MSDRYSLLDDWSVSDFRALDTKAVRRAVAKAMEPAQEWDAVLPWLARIDPGLPAEELRAHCLDSLAHAWKNACRHIKEAVVPAMPEHDLLTRLADDRDAFGSLVDSGAVVLDPSGAMALAA